MLVLYKLFTSLPMQGCRGLKPSKVDIRTAGYILDRVAVQKNNMSHQYIKK